MSLPSETKQFIKIELPNRNPLTSRLQDWGADWKIDGVSAEKDWRYDAFVDFLSYSPSYQMTCLFHYGRCSLLDLPADRDRLIEVYNDFGDYGALMESGWWSKTGRYLFGIRAPLPKVEAIGVLNHSKTRLAASRKLHDSLVVSLPFVLNKAQAIAQLKQLLNDYEFASPLTEDVQPKYQLQSSKLQKQTILDAFDALRLYMKGMALWQIGSCLKLLPPRFIDNLKSEQEKAKAVGEYKKVLAVAANREIRRGFYIAENAARGIFPSDQRVTDHYKKAWNLGFTPTGIVEAKPSRKSGRPAKKKPFGSPLH
jgi:hypothetical protein